jgi:hypothetical protein
MKITETNGLLGKRRGVGFSHGHRDGSLVLRGQTSWRTVNGVWLNLRRWTLDDHGKCIWITR